jgi:hypothetical protein
MLLRIRRTFLSFERFRRPDVAAVLLPLNSHLRPDPFSARQSPTKFQPKGDASAFGACEPRNQKSCLINIF